MRIALVAGAAVLGVSTHSAPLSDRDLQQLMEAAVTASASSWAPSVQTVCVQRELEPPLSLIKQPVGLAWINSSGAHAAKNTELDESVAAAMSPKAQVELRTTMPPLAGRYLMFSSETPRPTQCVIEHGPRSGDTSIALTFTRPAFANGLAFINEVEDCPGLCGNGILWVFKKQDGKWKQIAEAVLWVS
jgi:hypothetical protein